MNNQFLTKETNDLVKDIIVEAVKPKVPFLLRALVSPSVGIVLNLVNKYADKVVPDSVDGYINIAIKEAHTGNYNLAAASIGKAADTLIDIPNVDDVHESNLFISIAQAIVQGVKVWIEKKKAVKSA